MSKEKIKATIWAFVVTAILARLITLGSGNLDRFDAALVGYTFATLFAVFGITRRYALWLQRPPTAMYWTRGWKVFFLLLHPRHVLSNAFRFLRRLVAHYAFNDFIWRRSRMRWLAHWCIMWGCLTAGSITFPLVFGWIDPRSDPSDLAWYRIEVFGYPIAAFPIHSLFGFLAFHGLVWSSFLVIIGVLVALRRRLRDHGAAARQQSARTSCPCFSSSPSASPA
jgi:hypothetical protein